MHKIIFGLGKHNDIRAENIRTNGVETVMLDIISENGSFPIEIPGYGSHLAALAPAAAVTGRLLGLTDEEISRGFLSYAPVEGRSNVKKTAGVTLIDDCYNANPGSVKAALKSISKLSGRRVAILGDMLNLADVSEQMHREVGEYAALCGIDVLLCHGEQAIYICDGFSQAGDLKGRYYKHMSELISDIPEQIKKGDVVLVKASRGMHFEKLLPVISRLDQDNKTV